MPNEQNFVIAQMGSNFIGALETPEEERRRFSYLAAFLDENGLSTRKLVEEDGLVALDFALRRFDVTDQGFDLLRHALDRWLSAVDRTKNPQNVGILRRELEKMRSIRGPRVHRTA